MDHLSGVHLFHFFLIILRNFDSILRPFFAVQLNCNTRGSFSCISSNVFKRSNNTTVLFTLYQHQTNQLTQIHLLSLSIHGSFLAQVQYSRFSILTVSSSISNVFKPFQTAPTRPNLLSFYPRLFVTQVRYPRFSTLTVPPVFPTSSNTQTTPRLVRLHQHQTNHQICTPLPTAPSLHKFNIHGFSTCIPKYLQCFNQLQGTFFRLRHGLN